MTTHYYIEQLKLLNTQIEASLSYIENVRLLKGEAEADTVAENDLKSLLSYHSQKVEESQRQQHRVLSLDGALISGGNYFDFEKMSFVSSCISCAKNEETKAMDKSILKRVHGSEEYPVTWIIQLGAKAVLFSRVTNGRIDEDYAPVNRQKANVYASAILNDLEPPKHLQKSDRPTGQTQSE
ncbi:hypothetical protein KKJ01_10385 [Xenorhabdus bovienii]|uniref:Uncharacterized protein n=1 Tax=Xenorhabdus bovienii TaxID=40576 RepID=A0AAJ1J7N6_XENBV|nr:hypothetical protein [Xenorhabdus bovienii]MDE1478624.1 hypothetical protein [Xenorhabdus bovienii]MDE1492478.1 hypothetical protein [Xenorhabdus bovienii]MDE9512209.1 hypothetical protein [Xenorhabdus bovienii]MDE9523870.1 hypothetical protein [Xenorhabdus bovienii]